MIIYKYTDFKIVPENTTKKLLNGTNQTLPFILEAKDTIR